MKSMAKQTMNMKGGLAFQHCELCLIIEKKNKELKCKNLKTTIFYIYQK